MKVLQSSEEKSILIQNVIVFMLNKMVKEEAGELGSDKGVRKIF